MDNQGLLREGGRLNYADITFSKEHRILLPADTYLTLLTFTDWHQKLLHGGPQQLLSLISEEFWPISGQPEKMCILALSSSGLSPKFLVLCWETKPKIESRFLYFSAWPVLTMRGNEDELILWHTDEGTYCKFIPPRSLHFGFRTRTILFIISTKIFRLFLYRLKLC